MSEIRTRFAPSPTGYMHIGNLRTALWAYLVAKKDPNGKFLLRIEDTDQGRLVEGATDIIYETLKQCRLQHDEGPDIGGPVGPYVQSERVRSGIYMKYAKELIRRGGAHYCFCDSEMIAAQKEIQEARHESFKYDDPCKSLTIEEAEALCQKKDRTRATYYNYFTFGNWGVASNYDLCIDSSVLGIEGTADVIMDFAKRKGLL